MLEAQAAATLNHPHVCTIYRIDEHDGQQFIEMEYVDGLTLRRMLPVPTVEDALRYAAQIGEALHEAHSKGIVHRDIKAENVMVNSKDQVKVMDFGLAKLKGIVKLTRTSSTVGTLSYMAPEQLQGREVDARSDIFSLGVVLFEMLTGKTPFRGEHEAAMLYSILNEAPERLSNHLPDVQPELDEIVSRALEKDPDDRYQHVDDMVSQIRRLQKRGSSRVARPVIDDQPAPRASKVSRRGLNARHWLGIAAGVVLLATAAIFILKPGGLGGSAHLGRKMLVVLPFENLGPADQDYFADGITEEITSKLSGLSGLGVLARSSAMQYKKTTKSIRQIGEELGVKYILQGTLRWNEEGGTKTVRVSPQLIDVTDGTQIWAQPSEEVFAGAFKIQSEIAARVASALDVTLLQPEKQSLEATPTKNSDAYDAYLRGNDYLFRSLEERDWRTAEQLYLRAVELDPQFAEAYAKLGEVHSHLYWEFYDRTEERLQKSKAAAERALQLDPNLPEAHVAMGWYYYHGLVDYDNAIAEFSKALHSKPNDVDLLLGLASVYRRQGKMEEALSAFKRADEVDPRSADNKYEIALTAGLLRRYAEAEVYCDRAIGLSPDWTDPYVEKANIMLLWKGDKGRARELLELAERHKTGASNPELIYNWFFLNSFDGRYEEELDRLGKLNGDVLSDQMEYFPKDLLKGHLYRYLGDRGKQLTSYEAAARLIEHEVLSHNDDSRLFSSLGIAYAGLGRNSEAVRQGKHAVELLPVTRDALRGSVRLRDLACIHAMTGNSDAAVDELERLLSIPSFNSRAMLRIDPEWTPLRSNPRFQKLVAEAK